MQLPSIFAISRHCGVSTSDAHLGIQATVGKCLPEGTSVSIIRIVGKPVRQ